MKLKDGSTAVMRLVHVDNLSVYLRRGTLHAPNFAPADGLAWRATHRSDIQAARASAAVPRGPGGHLLDYVPFYFGSRGPMLYQLHTGRVAGYDEGQAPLIYLVASAEEIAAAGYRFVFYDGHALSSFSQCFDDLSKLTALDWPAIHAEMWSDTPETPDRQRRKQSEFLVYRELPWSLIRGIVVANPRTEKKVAAQLAAFGSSDVVPIATVAGWYYSERDD